MTFLALCAVSLAGCGERHDARPPAAAAAAASPPGAAVTAPAPEASAAADKGGKAGREKGRGAAELKVKRLVLAEGVKDREPVAPGTTFRAPETERLYAFLEIENRGDAEGEVTVAFVPPDGGAPVGNVTLGVGPSPRWRTWAFTRGVRKAGEWTAVVRSETGEELARAPFEVTL
ncbi:DUF2914 domain-containing protein [Sorangium cellulosum]|uniref:DUF2914 domain-containing protein n=1 Tax=Sorangium cellulosum So0157-2 TaxID=1254432 RepID=S4XMJ7_SORCE|nr:DUF2914 domain-containing protein [Sorangium cellulosum]AGP33651.1 hypothetical protein SCE1572_03545 [Sorangium cellulosum So0157-2]